MDPFDEGLEAYLSGLAITDNPYPDNSDDAFDWTEGWLEGEEDSFR